MRNVKTDRTLNDNLNRQVQTGKLKGTPKMLNPYTVFTEQDSPVNVLMNVVFGAYQAHKGDFVLRPGIALTDAMKTGKLPSLGKLFDSLDGDVKQAVADFQTTAEQLEQAYQLTGNTPPSPQSPRANAIRPLTGELKRSAGGIIAARTIVALKAEPKSCRRNEMAATATIVGGKNTTLPTVHLMFEDRIA